MVKHIKETFHLFWARQVRQIRQSKKHAMYAIFWRRPNTQFDEYTQTTRSSPFYEARQARKHAKLIEHAKHANT